MQKTETLHWIGGPDGHLRMIDQTRLPVELVEIDCRTVEAVWEAIKLLRVRSAPAIGIAAAYGVCVGLQAVAGQDEAAPFRRLEEVTAYLATSRPTAVNLFWALDRMKSAAGKLHGKPPGEITAALLHEARTIHEEDRAMRRAIGEHGAKLLADGQGVLTHCNAGGLATSEYGTALAVFFMAAEQGKRLVVYADETRPLLQGARLTAWELQNAGLHVTLDLRFDGRPGDGRGPSPGRRHGGRPHRGQRRHGQQDRHLRCGRRRRRARIPFYIAAPPARSISPSPAARRFPSSSATLREITHGFGRQTAPEGVKVYNPAFDVTPAELIVAIIRERGVIRPVTRERIADMVR